MLSLFLSGWVRGNRVRHSQGMAGQWKKAVCRGWAAGRSSKEGFIIFAWSGRHGVRKAKARLELILLNDVKENKRCFCATLAVKGWTRKLGDHCWRERVRNQTGISLDRRKSYFPLRTVRSWSWLLRETELVLSLEVFKEINWIKSH